MKCQKKWWERASSSSEEQQWRGWRHLCQEHLANIIHLTGYCGMFFTLTSHRTWTLTRNNDLEALTGDREKGRGGWGRETRIDILLSAPAANNQSKWLFFCGWKVGEPVTCMRVLVPRLVAVIPPLIFIRAKRQTQRGLQPTMRSTTCPGCCCNTTDPTAALSIGWFTE